MVIRLWSSSQSREGAGVSVSLFERTPKPKSRPINGSRILTRTSHLQNSVFKMGHHAGGHVAKEQPRDQPWGSDPGLSSHSIKEIREKQGSLLQGRQLNPKAQGRRHGKRRTRIGSVSAQELELARVCRFGILVGSCGLKLDDQTLKCIQVISLVIQCRVLWCGALSCSILQCKTVMTEQYTGERCGVMQTDHSVVCRVGQYRAMRCNTVQWSPLQNKGVLCCARWYSVVCLLSCDVANEPLSWKLGNLRSPLFCAFKSCVALDKSLSPFWLQFLITCKMGRSEKMILTVNPETSRSLVLLRRPLTTLFSAKIQRWLIQTFPKFRVPVMFLEESRKGKSP